MPSPIRSEFPEGLRYVGLTRLTLDSSRQGTGTRVHAEGFDLGDVFLVLTGSQALIEEAPALVEERDAWIRELREALIEDGVLEQEGEVYVFQRDCAFSAPARATSAILARSASGHQEWEDESGIKLRDL